MTNDSNQPPQPSLLDGFGNLKEIYEARNVHVRKQTTLEQLTEIGELIKAKFCPLVNVHTPFKSIHENVYTNAYDMAVGFFINGRHVVSYNEGDLKEYITSNLNRDESISEKIIIGIYTGLLLDILTRRNKSKDNGKGKRTRFYINGQGNKFDYLFFFAKSIDELIVDNFSGDGICSRIGSHHGNSNSIALLNIVGDNTGSGIAFEHGRVEQVISINNIGKNLISCGGGYYGSIGHVVVVDDIHAYLPTSGFAEINGSKTIIIDYKHGYTQNPKNERDANRMPYNYKSSDLRVIEQMLSLAAQMKDKPEQEILKHLDELRRIMPNAPKGNFEIH